MGKRELLIPEEIYRAIADNLSRLGASSVEEFVVYLLTDELRRQGILRAYGPEEEKALEEHLRDLGYTD
ncbi:MAG TPA: hypothetical protein ENF77_00760 [Candidatus Acetothermia bacterium]|nr:hypothetical protein [Candidatus Acetothermia bacterium]